MASEDIQYRTLNQLAQLQLDYITANAPVTLTKPVGPFITAIAYAVALVALVLQRLIQLVLKDSRLSTATGDAVDTFVADFGLSRSPAVKAQGNVTLGRLATAPTLITIPTGKKVQTPDVPPIEFLIIAPTGSHASYDPGTKAYTLLGGTTEVTSIPVEAIKAGVIGNVPANRVTVIASSIPGIDYVTNPLAFGSGRDADTDDEMRQVFVDYIQSLTRGTAAAIKTAVNNVQTGLFFKIVEPNPPTGTVTIYVDDGSGAITNPTVEKIAAAIAEVRPVGVRVTTTGAAAVAYCIMARVVYPDDLVPDVRALQAVIRNGVLDTVNGSVGPGDKVHFSTLYKTIFNANSPGDLTIKSVAYSPPSTTSRLNLSDVEGLATGQLLKVIGYTTATGVLPKVVSIGGNPTEIREDGNPPPIHEVEISPPLTAIPPSGTSVEAFSVRTEQIADLHDLILKPRRLSTTTDGQNSTTIIPVTSTTSVITGDEVIITDESNPDNFVFYQSQPGLAVPTVSTVQANVSVTLVSPVGIISSTGDWTATMPPVGARVVFLAGNTAGAGRADVIATNNQVVRILASAGNQVLIQMETE